MSGKVTVPRIRAMRAQGERIVCITAYDALFGRLADEAGADLVLVGDSVGNTLLGYENTLPVTLDDIVRHTRAVRAGLGRALLVADMPFGSYESGTEDAIRHAVLLIKNGAEAVKLEGNHPDTVAALVAAGIPVMGHVGMTPQHVHRFGGFRIQGRDNAEEVLQAACRLDEAGCFAMVLELIPGDLAARITQSVQCPTIGIGAGPACSGEIQVIYDVLGFSEKTYKHARAFASLRHQSADALSAYVASVRKREFPTEENTV
jgi:3-methyl-2-oxobutanoate hydroxymethyltransferase